MGGQDGDRVGQIWSGGEAIGCVSVCGVEAARGRGESGGVVEGRFLGVRGGEGRWAESSEHELLGD